MVNRVRDGRLGLVLLASTALCPLPSSDAQAQARRPAQPDAGSSIVLDEITITGETLANRRAIETKRESPRIQDSVSGDEVGKLPDFNAGDAIKRIAGVNVLTYQGEPRFVTIRGLSADYNTTTVDGFHMASPDVEGGGRRIYMEVLPSSFASRIDVVKSATPDVDGHAIGGIVNFQTPSAFDFAKDTYIVTGKGGAYLQAQKDGGRTPTGQFDILATKRFGRNDEFGLAIGGSYWRRVVSIPQIESGGQQFWYDNAGRRAAPYGGNGIAVPQERRWYVYDNTRQRQGGNAKFDWRPSDAFRTSFGAYYFSQQEESNRNEVTAANTGTGVTNQTPTSGTITANQNVQLGRLRFDRSVYGFNNTTEYAPADKLKLDVKLGWSGATLSNPQTWDNFSQSGLPFIYSTATGLPVFTALNSANYQNLARYALVNHRYETQDLKTNNYEGQINLAYNTAVEDRGFGFKIGGSWLRTDRDQTTTRTLYSGMPYTLADVAGRSALCPYACSGTNFFVIDPALADAQFARNIGRARTTTDNAYAFGGTYGLQEDIAAGYGLVQFNADRWRAQAGLRYEQTSFSSAGFKQTNGVFGPTQNTNDYRNLLPSASMSYDLAPDLRTRLAYSRTVGRGKYSDLADRGGQLQTNGSQILLTQSNSSLRPRVSDNFDLTQEWYLDQNKGLLSVGVFAKTIKDEIFTYGQIETINIGGVNQPVLVTQARNSESPAKVHGLEFNFIKTFDFLPEGWNGFGVIANGTFVKGSLPITLGDGRSVKSRGLPQQADKSFNLILFYEKGPWKARVAWNYTGRLWDDRFSNLTNAAEFYRNRYQAPLHQVNLQLAYDVNDNLKLTLDAFNITRAGLQNKIGRDLEITQTKVGLAPAILAGASYKW